MQKMFLQSPSYAPQTFFGLPDSRVVQMSWITTVFQGMPFASCMSVPWELKLISRPEGCRLIKAPLYEITSLREEHSETRSSDPLTATKDLSSISGEALDLELRAYMVPDGRLAFAIRGVLIVYDHRAHQLIFPTGIYTLPVSESSLDMRVIADRGSIELFCCKGLFNCVLNSPLDIAKKTVEFFDIGASSACITLYKLNSIWN
jgi:sucrose-6-phosphate hydrolase SacC (GH32 family)